MRESLRERMRSTDAMLGTFVLLPRVETVEGLGYAGFEFVILDLEHGPFAVDELPTLIAAANGVGMYALVRVASASDSSIGSVLDAGADGVLVPHVSDAASAGAVVTWSRFAPDGDRSFNPYVRAARYNGDQDYLKAANDGVAVIVMVEGREGLDALSSIAAVHGIDGVFIGPVDLSAALGLPGQPEHPKVQESIRSILEHLDAAGVASGIYAPTAEAAVRWQGLKTRMVAMSADMAMAFTGFRSFIEQVEKNRGASAQRSR